MNHASTNRLAFRSSCDRCRSQKLKCTISPESSTVGTPRCVRCRRAKLECVFSRRRGPGHAHAHRQDASYIHAGPHVSCTQAGGSCHDGSGSGSGSDNNSSRKGVRGDMSSRSSVSMDAVIAAGTSTGYATVPQMPIHASIAENGGMGILQAGGGDGNGDFAMQRTDHGSQSLPADLSLEFALGLGAQQIGVGSGSYGHNTLDFSGGTLNDFSCELPAPAAEGVASQKPARAGTSNSDGNINDHTGSMKPLLALIIESDGMNERLACGSWVAHAGGRNSSIDNYPVGWVLSLVEDYRAILCGLQFPSAFSRNAAASATLALANHSQQNWSQSCTNGQHCSHHGPAASSMSPLPGTMYHSQSPPSISSSSSGQSLRSTDSRFMGPASGIEREEDSTADLSSILLLLSAYLRLTRLLSLVFSHFETYLRDLRTSRSTRHSGIGNGANRFQQHGKGLQLGQLPSTHETCSKIYAAVQLLLDALQQVEESAGLPIGARVRRRGAISPASLRDRTPSTTPPREGSLLLFELDVAKTLLWRDCEGDYAHGNCPEVDELAARVASVQGMLRDMMK